MPRRRSEAASPDLFTAPSAAAAPVRPAAGEGKLEPDKRGSQARHLLPKDLAGALTRLDDAEVDALLVAVTAEAERRGRLPRKQTGVAKKEQRKPPAGDASKSLTTGKLNAVRAAFQAGVKPSVIARQFGISQSDVRTALAPDPRQQKADR